MERGVDGRVGGGGAGCLADADGGENCTHVPDQAVITLGRGEQREKTHVARRCGDELTRLTARGLTYPVKATACLGWIRGLLKYFPPSRHPKVGCLSAGAHFTRICCAILACHNAGALCFNTSGAVIGDLLGLLVPFVDLSDLDQRPETYLPLDMLSFYDLFIELVEHFAGVSYSAPIFSNILLLFLQTSSLPANYRRALWGEHQTALRALVISPREYILSAASYKGLFEPVEGDEGVLRSYASALCSGLIQPCRQPILALIAIHHLNRNIYSLSAKAEHASFLSQLSSSLKFIASRGSPEAVQMLDYLRRYKAPVVPNSPAIPISQLSNSNYTSIGCAKVTDLMQLYEENELPPLRIKRWDEFMQ
ncbi:unnamed protein product [Mesocestoides corti]|uniref:RPAP1/MINIYO-like TPR repeats domain-containing protein n=2 Tax=Mesocestoides corti TaxID=53468 RepID=A0A0R3U2I0_MESCO|nr:unnamed protein product [Mesocestoides corti]